MEALGILEGRIKSLVELACKLKDDNARLKEENLRLERENFDYEKKVSDLQFKINSFEGAFAQSNKDFDELSQEKELTKLVVDDLIKSIETLVQENQQ